MDLYEIRAYCDVAGCGGELSGPVTTRSGLYEYTCPRCGHVHLMDAVYPLAETEQA